MNELNLEQQLLEAGYPGLFLYGDRSQSETIWNEGSQKDALQNIIVNSESSLQSKFLSAEILKKYNTAFTTEVQKELPAAYSDALKNSSEVSGNTYRLSGNAWGLFHTGEIGPLGDRMIEFGDEVIPFLAQLLNDDGIILFDGSEEATLGNQFNYRVKDFAAFYISKIGNIPVTFHADINERDKEIDRLKNIVSNIQS